MKTLDRESPLPLWAQLADDLRSRIAQNEFGERFATDEELSRDYGVSRQTVREAIRELRASGLVERQRGRGSFVRSTALEQPMQALYSLARSIEEQGLEERSEVLSCAETRDPQAASALGLPSDAPLLRLERVRFAGEEPLALDRSWLPAEIGSRLPRTALERGSLYEAIAEHAGLRATGGRERIRAAEPDGRTRGLLMLPRGEAVLVIERLVLVGNRPIEWRVSSVRGDRFSLSTDWQR